MEIRQINQDFAVAGQIGAEHIQAIADAGFKSVVCNRPDTEDGAVPHAEVEAAVRAAGLEFRFIPVVSGAVTEDNVSEMSAALATLPRPVLAYCRTGGRCTNLYGLVQQTAG
ncbi:TIGR01244 family phosphatase [Nitratireductor sp. CAU 1489]|uniref:TIGR01244 family phosphatase n=1 Tax=Nitratireductor arenosus TaxID=2682096 RepID=A0A844QNJ1_9HYPH|nr:TIGR01244 family sulfur transferase [Nitratireductor arenosus]MVA99533.1 TIGR01244 family phosphatase [Nitratireductor arenosus]